MYNGVGGSGGILPRENLNFQNLRNAIFGLLALMFALLQKLSLLNLQAIFLVTPPLHTIFFRLAPPSNPTSPPYLIKNERSLNQMATHNIFIRSDEGLTFERPLHSRGNKYLFWSVFVSMPEEARRGPKKLRFILSNQRELRTRAEK